MMSEAAKLGPATTALFEAIMKAKPHPEQGFRSCLGIISLVKSYGPARVEAACRAGNDIGATTYGSIASILKNGLDRAYAKHAGETTTSAGVTTTTEPRAAMARSSACPHPRRASSTCGPGRQRCSH